MNFLPWKEPMDIVQYPLPKWTGYFPTETKKMQIYLHHTVSGPNPISVIDYWKSKANRVGTFMVIAGDTDGENYQSGQMFQCFSSKHWAWHLGIESIPRGGEFSSTELNKYSVGIEICNAGPLKLTASGFKDIYGREYDDDEVIEYPEIFRGSRFYHRYTNDQIETLYSLLDYLCKTYNISRCYKGRREVFNLSEEALTGQTGIYSHVSVNPHKQDCHPQPELIKMLKAL